MGPVTSTDHDVSGASRLAELFRARSDVITTEPADLPQGAQSEAPCPTLEEAFLAISQATSDANLAAISAALAEVEADPLGAASAQASPLAARLRTALGIRAEPVCQTVLMAVREAIQLAQIASAAEAGGPPTGAVGAPSPLSPSYSTVLPGTTGGARAHGYCPDLRTGCVG
jgi:hypothetical protein